MPNCSIQHHPPFGTASCNAVRRILGSALATVVALAMATNGVAAQRPDNTQVREAIEAYEAGELQRALDLLQGAPALLSNRDAAIRGLYLGLVHFALNDTNRSRDAFMRAVMLDASVRLDPAVHSPGRIQAFEAARAVVLEGWRTEAMAAAERGDTTLAVQRWQAVLRADPEDANARARLDAIEQARRPAVTPDPVTTPDSVVVETEPAAAADSAAPVRRLRSPGSAFAIGLVIPGMGEVYAGRGTLGVLALAAAGGAVAAGYLAESVDVRCATVPVGDVCPPDDVVSETTDRPYLGAGIAVAAGVTLLAALDAFLATRRDNARIMSESTDGGAGLEVLPLSVSASPSIVRLDLLRLRF